VPERPVSSRRTAMAVVATVVVAWFLAVPGVATAAPYPTLPVGDGAILLGNLSAPTLTPGASGALTFSVVNPLSFALSAATLTLDVYAFNAFPGNATSTVPVAGAPVLANASASGPLVEVGVGALAPRARYAGSVEVATSGTTPSGAFAVRTELQFLANGTAYRLASRGWFTAAQWASATELPNGSATLNLTALGVSGVLPETAIVVASSAVPWALAGVAAGGVAFVGLGAWFYFRRESSSRSGTRRDDSDQ
jgi:hypothetical protein